MKRIQERTSGLYPYIFSLRPFTCTAADCKKTENLAND